MGFVDRDYSTLIYGKIPTPKILIGCNNITVLIIKSYFLVLKTGFFSFSVYSVTKKYSNYNLMKIDVHLMKKFQNIHTMFFVVCD